MQVRSVLIQYPPVGFVGSALPIGPKPTVPKSVYATLGSDVHEHMFRSGGQSDAKPRVLSPQASLVRIYRPTEGMKVLVNLIQPGV
ncbi:hypothetical protein TNCV_1485311 [Trichonephila clavipes]|nr:hypothetical protein TNCV_1485311 [Trichonephila clavipes]